MALPGNRDTVEVNSRSKDRVSTLERLEEGTNLSSGRIPAKERLAIPREELNPSAERISALERIEAPHTEQAGQTGLSSSILARLQDVAVQYENEEYESPLLGEGSSRRPPSTTQAVTQQETSRTPATLRLGSFSNTGKRKNPPKSSAKKGNQAKQTTQRKPNARVTGTTRSRGLRSPLQGAKASKQLAARVRPPARWREKSGNKQRRHK
ncbi:unnamed protein product [Eruca vesicaria subsp. sativa]|uniref:Uncharacterized protein n=1 Tax=Eruca vesicaria subsp. sativa TaxID=29727 RepID=A0ABC8K5G7_ERUVS|nr:unnamed protein product [Eruca vesicaria subsp. sativa]